MKVGGLQAADLRRSSVLTDPVQVVSLLGLGDGAIRQGSRGLKIRCPAHADSTASCSVREGDDGTLQVTCFGCSLSGDVFSLIAAVHSLDTRRDFPAIKKIASDLAAVEPGSAPPPPAPPRVHAPAQYPPANEVAAVWAKCVPVLDAPEVSAWLRSRGLDSGAVEDFDLARAIPDGVVLPWWAAQGSRTWIESGHKCIVPLFDATGALRSLRSRRVTDGDSVKVLAPRSCKTAGLIMADAGGRLSLAGGERFWPEGEQLRVVISEGDADFLSWATRFSDADESAPAVFGMFSGSWCPAIAARIPDGAYVAIWTDHDEAGAKYATTVAASLQDRCEVLRGVA